MDILNAHTYIERCLWIKNKNGQLQRLKLNPPQEKLYGIVREQARARKPVRIIILKARQEGFSTLTEALLFHATATQFNREALIVAHREDATANLFRMSKRYYELLDEPMKPMLKASNAQELVFENPSKNPHSAGTACRMPSRVSALPPVPSGQKAYSEMCTNCSVSLRPMPRPPAVTQRILLRSPGLAFRSCGTMVIIESTANGFDDFKNMWDRAVAGESDFVPLFFAWFENPEYRRPVPPDTAWTQEERDLQKQYGLEEEQLAWRRWCIANNCGGDVRKFHQEYPSNPEEAFLHSGEGVFDNEAVQRQLERCGEPIMRGRFIDGSFTESSAGEIAIYERPIPGRPYVLGGDTAGEGSDWFTGIVIDNVSGEIAAVLHRQYSEPEYTRQMFDLGRWYNDALLGVEVNFSTYPNAKLQEMGYPRLYVREREDTYTKQLRESYGFRTDRNTRPRIIANLVETFEAHPEWFTDKELLREMLRFVYNEDHRPEAMAGEHDDLVMGTAIAYAIRWQQASEDQKKDKKKKNPKWTEDMWADYRGASSELQALMREEWGDPT